MDTKTICLAILAQGEATGYEIQKTIKDGPLAHFFDASFGSIYPALARLSDDSLIECRAVSEDGKPDRKVYAILPRGRLRLSNALMDVPMTDKVKSPFLAAMLFSSLIGPREIYRLVEGRMAVHRSVLHHLDASEQKPLSRGETFVHGYARAIHQAALDFLDQHLEELENEVLTAQHVEALAESRR